MFHAQPEVIGASSANEIGIAQGMTASASAKAPMLVGVLPMGGDPTSALFAAAMNARGLAFLGVHGIHAANRVAFAGGQQLAADTITVTEAIHAATSVL
ncbi:PE2 protein [Mycobacteroides abscessus subsp. abscessus]|nr:PE2 protein [Mycobacteroides abscessus subsp. abscessus]